MDNCCLNRPFDDQSNLRIHLESEAIQAIIKLCEQQKWHLISSQILKFEISKVSDESKRRKLKLINDLAEKVVKIDEKITIRSQKFEKFGLQAFDAMHLACAENNSDIFLTVDDKFLRKAQQIQDLNLNVNNPLRWLEKVLL
jgi:predicted nucleic acid-binding protein